jgi:hypothetical protein
VTRALRLIAIARAFVRRTPSSMTQFCLAGLTTLLIALVGPAAPLAAQPADQVTFPLLDVVIDNHLPRFATWQQSYVGSHGRYFQSLWSHTSEIDEGASTAPDQLNSRPTDQAETFGDMWVTGGVRIGLGRLGWRFRLDIFDGPCGQGYVVVIETMRLSVVYTRSIVIGGGQCESWREEPWHRRPEAGL